jgi:hypothetical protein
MLVISGIDRKEWRRTSLPPCTLCMGHTFIVIDDVLIFLKKITHSFNPTTHYRKTTDFRGCFGKLTEGTFLPSVTPLMEVNLTPIG